MKLIIGGAIAIILAIIGFSLNFGAFVKFLAGIVPICLILGGGLALYLYREMKCDDCDDIEDCCAADPTEAIAVGTDTVEAPKEEPTTEPEPAKAAEPLTEAVVEPEVVQETKTEPEPQEKVEEAKADAVPSDAEKEKPDPSEPVAQKEEAPPQEVEEKSEPDEAEEKTETRFVGNIDSMVFHTPDCQFSQSKKCTAFFDTKEAAIEGGYKPCGVCKP